MLHLAKIAVNHQFADDVGSKLSYLPMLACCRINSALYKLHRGAQVRVTSTRGRPTPDKQRGIPPCRCVPMQPNNGYRFAEYRHDSAMVHLRPYHTHVAKLSVRLQGVMRKAQVAFPNTNSSFGVMNPRGNIYPTALANFG